MIKNCDQNTFARVGCKPRLDLRVGEALDLFLEGLPLCNISGKKFCICWRKIVLIVHKTPHKHLLSWLQSVTAPIRRFASFVLSRYIGLFSGSLLAREFMDNLAKFASAQFYVEGRPKVCTKRHTKHMLTWLQTVNTSHMNPKWSIVFWLPNLLWKTAHA
jgi:hypothetical protein